MGGKGRSFEALLALYVEDLQMRGLSASLKYATPTMLSPFFEHLHRRGVVDIVAASEEDLVSYALYLQERKNRMGQLICATTRSTYLSRIRAFFLFLEKRGFLLRNPARDLPLPRPEQCVCEVLSQAEARRLMSAPSAWTILGRRDRAVLETLYGTGIRSGECVRADTGDLNLDQRVLLVRNGKGRKDRIVPLPGRALAAVEEYLRECRPELVRRSREQALFVTVAGHRMNRQMLWAMIRSRARDAGCSKRVYPHLLRRTCATHLLAGGADVRHIQELLGHEHVTTTVTYTRVQIEDLKKVLSKSHPRARASKRRRKKG